MGLIQNKNRDRVARAGNYPDGETPTGLVTCDYDPTAKGTTACVEILEMFSLGIEPWMRCKIRVAPMSEFYAERYPVGSVHDFPYIAFRRMQDEVTA